MSMDKSYDVGAMKAFSLLDSRRQRMSKQNLSAANFSREIALRLYYSEMCIRITIGDHEQKIMFDDIYGVEVQEPSLDQEEPVLVIHTFANEEFKDKNCCGCSKNTVHKKRVIRQVSLLASSMQIAQEWHRRLLWAIDLKMYRDDSDPHKRKILVLLNPFGGAGAA